jgi:hypothetical protein
MEAGRQSELECLERELQFLDCGGYEQPSWSPWPTPRVFQDSPSCPRICEPAWPHSCQDCWLAQFVPPELLLGPLGETAPCRLIDLTGDGDRAEFLHRWGTPEESREALREWLYRNILEAVAPLEHWRAPEFLRSVDRVHARLQRQKDQAKIDQAKIMESLLLENGDVEPGRRIDPFVDWSSVATRSDRRAS